MAEGVTTTGLEEYRRAVQTLPDTVKATLQAIAAATATRIQARAKDILTSKLKTDRQALIDAIVVDHDAANQRYQVISLPPRGQPQNVPIWVEYGTKKMEARPYMRPSADAEQDRYVRESQAASADVLRKALT
jgi:plasmid stability protein